jgi:hypothetical protein
MQVCTPYKTPIRANAGWFPVPVGDSQIERQRSCQHFAESRDDHVHTRKCRRHGNLCQQSKGSVQKPSKGPDAASRTLVHVCIENARLDIEEYRQTPTTVVLFESRLEYL